MAQQVVVMASLVGLGLAGIVLLTRKLKGGKKSAPIPPDHGAFVERFQILPPPHPPPPAAPLPLSGKTFAVKNMSVHSDSTLALQCMDLTQQRLHGLYTLRT